MPRGYKHNKDSLRQHDRRETFNPAHDNEGGSAHYRHHRKSRTKIDRITYDYDPVTKRYVRREE